jgi:HEAT repeat protein
MGADRQRFLIGLCMTYEPWTQIEYPATAEGLIEMLGGEDQVARLGAQERRKALDDPPAVDLLIAALEGPNVVIRRYVADLLEGRPDARFIDPLIARLKDEDGDVRRNALEALSRIKAAGK